MFYDTIAAISTPPGQGGIGIVRISGRESFEVVRKIFKPVKPYNIDEVKTQTLKYGHIINPVSKEIIDEVLVSYFREPYTYTRENITEINCHGGALVLKGILELVVQQGARIAEPGEFTKRAFLNGRLDLSQAEAVIEMINSKTNAERKVSLNQLEGKLSEKIGGLRNLLVECIADIEAGIDFPEYDIEEVSREKISERIDTCLNQVKGLLKTFFEGRIIKEGITVAIVGKPNVGKSSLLNALAQKEKAIITEVPGTTRDIIEEYIVIGGVAVRVLDTAGLRQTEDRIEKIGIDRTKAAIERADLILLVLDGSEEIEEEDREIFKLVKERKAIVVINKSDLDIRLDIGKVREVFAEKEIIEISAREETGLDKIERKIKDMFIKNELEYDNLTVITNVRHKRILEEAEEELEEVVKTINSGLPVDMLSSAITQAADKLGEITGETVGEEVLHTIFSKFCIGK